MNIKNLALYGNQHCTQVTNDSTTYDCATLYICIWLKVTILYFHKIKEYALKVHKITEESWGDSTLCMHVRVHDSMNKINIPGIYLGLCAETSSLVLIYDVTASLTCVAESSDDLL